MGFGRTFEGIENFKEKEVEEILQKLIKEKDVPAMKIKPKTGVTLQEAEDYWNNIYKGV